MILFIIITTAIIAAFLLEQIHIIITIYIGIFIVIIISIFGLLIPHIRKIEKKQRIIENIQLQNKTIQEVYLERLERSLNPSEIDRATILKDIIPSTTFTNSDEKKTCAICKIEIREGQKVYQCKECLWFFHVDHLILWLVDNEKCPICKHPLEI